MRRRRQWRFRPAAPTATPTPAASTNLPRRHLLHDGERIHLGGRTRRESHCNRRPQRSGDMDERFRNHPQRDVRHAKRCVAGRCWRRRQHSRSFDRLESASVRDCWKLSVPLHDSRHAEYGDARLRHRSIAGWPPLKEGNSVEGFRRCDAERGERARHHIHRTAWSTPGCAVEQQRHEHVLPVQRSMR